MSCLQYYNRIHGFRGGSCFASFWHAQGVLFSPVQSGKCVILIGSLLCISFATSHLAIKLFCSSISDFTLPIFHAFCLILPSLTFLVVLRTMVIVCIYAPLISQCVCFQSASQPELSQSQLQPPQVLSSIERCCNI